MLRITLELPVEDARRLLAAADSSAPGETLLLPARATFRRGAAGRRPVVFLGSSSEGLEVAQAVGANLERVCEISLWTQGAFPPGRGYLESLLDLTRDVDFAVLVLTPDDMTTSRKKRSASPRDNVLFELGLFMGALGRDRTIALHDQTLDLKLPSDLAGVSLVSYQPPDRLQLRNALSGPCFRIQEAIRKHCGA